MKPEKAALLMWEAARAVLGDLSGVLGKEALEWVAEWWSSGRTYNGTPRRALLKAHALEIDALVGELIPAAAKDIQAAATTCAQHGRDLSRAQCDALHDRLAWRSAQAEDKPPDFESWRQLSAKEKLAFAPTIYC